MNSIKSGTVAGSGPGGRAGISFLSGAAIIAVVTFIAYVPALSGGFLWDDDILITKNMLIQGPGELGSFWWTWKPVDYIPLTNTTLWCEWRLWGMNATGYHVTNVLLHVAGALLLWRVLLKLKAPWSWLVALIFAVHPVNAGSAAWISERKNTLSLLFFLLTLLFYFRFEEKSRRRWYFLSLAMFMLALMSKASVVMLPFVLLGCAWWLRRRISIKDALRTAPFFVMSAAMAHLTIWFQSNRSIGIEIINTGDWPMRLSAAGRAVWFYLFKTLLPVHLSMVYPRWSVDDVSVARMIVLLLPGVLLAGAFVLFWRRRKSWGRPLMFGLGYFVAMLFPVLGLIKMYFLRYSMVADHWVYLSTIGAIALAVGAMNHAALSWGRGGRRTAAVAAVLLVAVLCAMTWQTCRTRRNLDALWRGTLRDNPTGPVVNESLGVTLAEGKRFRTALVHLKKATDAAPDDNSWRLNLALTLIKDEQRDEGIAQLRRLELADPTYVNVHQNLAQALMAQGRLDEAAAEYREVFRLEPGDSDAHYNLAWVYVKQRKFAEAAAEYEASLAIKPGACDAENNLGNVLLELGKPAEAADHYAKAAALNPTSGTTRHNYGSVLLMLGKFLEAADELKEAARLMPDDPDVWQELGAASQKLGRKEAADAAFARAAELRSKRR